MSCPTVSVIIPTYNYARFVGQAIRSVLSQTFTEYEIIVVDDGSTDETPEVLASFGDCIRIIRQDNAGQSAAQNRGIRESRGEFIAFLDADDLWYPDKLTRQVQFLRDNPQYGMAYSDMTHMVNGVKINHYYLREMNYKFVSSGWIYTNLLREGFIFMPTVMIRRECLFDVGLFDESLKNCQDVDLWFRVANKYQIGFIDESLAIRNQHGANVTADKENYYQAPIELMERLAITNKDPERLSIIKERLRQMYFNLGYFYFDRGKYSLCRKYMLKSISHGGRLAYSLKYLLLSLFPQKSIKYLKKLKNYR